MRGSPCPKASAFTVSFSAEAMRAKYRKQRSDLQRVHGLFGRANKENQMKGKVDQKGDKRNLNTVETSGPVNVYDIPESKQARKQESKKVRDKNTET